MLVAESALEVIVHMLKNNAISDREPLQLFKKWN